MSKPVENETEGQMILSPTEASHGGMAEQYSLDGFGFVKTLVDPSKPYTSHTVELWSDPGTGEKLVVKTVAPGLEHTLSADIIGQRFFNLLGLPTPKTSLTQHDGKYCLVMEYLEDYHESEESDHLPAGMTDNQTVKSGILADIWLNHYDRQPYNFMFKGDKVMFIDFGGSLTSSPSGKITGLKDGVDEHEIYKNVKAFQGDFEVNEAYGSVLKIDPVTEGFEVVDEGLIHALIKKLGSVTDEYIDAIVDENILPEQRQNLTRIQSIIDNMEQNLSIPIEKLHYAHYHYNFKEALETFTMIRDKLGGDESAYLKYALKKRRDDLVKIFSQGEL